MDRSRDIAPNVSILNYKGYALLGENSPLAGAVTCADWKPLWIPACCERGKWRIAGVSAERTWMIHLFQVVMSAVASFVETERVKGVPAWQIELEKL